MIRSRRLFISLLLAIVVSTAGLLSAGNQLAVAKGEGTMSLFLATSWTHRLQEIDPMSLTNMKPGKTRLIGPSTLWSARPQIIVSPGGSYLSAVYYRSFGTPVRPRDTTVRSWDASGARRGPPFHPQALLWIAGLSADGSELYGFGYKYTTNYQQTQQNGFYVLSAVDGHTMYHLAVPANSGNYAYDSVNHRLYILDEAPWTSGDMPPAPTLEAYDVVSGKQLGSLRLDGILSGSKAVDASSNNDPVMQIYYPGFALSPNGKQIAILDGSSDTLIAIDTANLAIEQRVTVAQPKSFLERLGETLGVLPTAAEAKEMKGVTLSMMYSPDGSSLIVTGAVGKQDAQGRYLPSSLGMKRIDVATGEIRAQLDTTEVWGLQFMPDGSALYGTTGNTLQFVRFDPQSLQMMATRPLDQNAEVYMLATGGS